MAEQELGKSTQLGCLMLKQVLGELIAAAKAGELGIAIEFAEGADRRPKHKLA